jgi:general secretion pathway protein K
LKKEPETETEQFRFRINAPIPDVAFKGGRFQIRLGNECGKVNINKAGRSLIFMMLNRFEDVLTEKQRNIIADSILDWRDEDDLHHLNGAESKYYESLPEPYECKNGDFDSVEELLLVKGITPEIFYGGLKDMTTVLYVEEPKSGKKGEKKSSAKKDDDEDTETSYDYNKININAAHPVLLRSLPGMTDDLVKKIVEFRKTKDIVSMQDLIQIVGSDVSVAATSYLTFDFSPFYTVETVGLIDDSLTRQKVMAVVHLDDEYDEKYKIIQWYDDID